MDFPEELQSAVKDQLLDISQAQILLASERISERYRTRKLEKTEQFIRGKEEALAYMISRMPATYGAVSRVISLAFQNIEKSDSYSLLDVGAGTGAATWAVSAAIPLHEVVCIERNKDLKNVGAKMMQSGSAPLSQTRWVDMDVAQSGFELQSDIVIESYMLNEIETSLQLEVAEKLWRAAKQMLIFIEPGTPLGYEVLSRVRERLVSLGADLTAPCPHNRACPLLEGDWCHFTCRIQRSRLHKLAKGGDAPFEDEKFSFLVFSKKEKRKRGARILRHPYIGKGFVKLELCEKEGLFSKTVTKRDGDLYKKLRKSKCGDEIFLDNTKMNH